MSLYKNRYRIDSARLNGWDYTAADIYFITICTKNKMHWFGEVTSETPGIASVKLSDIGLIVQEEWLRTPEIRADMNLLLDEFVVMPNHFHGIIFIGENDYNREDAMHGDATHRDATHGVSTIKSTKIKFGPQRKNLGSVIRGFKSAVTAKARIKHPGFTWQERYHDHIIRNHESFIKIQVYIINNPANWEGDTFYGIGPNV